MKIFNFRENKTTIIFKALMKYYNKKKNKFFVSKKIFNNYFF